MSTSVDIKSNKDLQVCVAGLSPVNFTLPAIGEQFVINMPDDSMSGTIEAGDQCLVKSHSGNLWDAVYLYELDGRYFVKRLQTMKDKLIVISDNKFYETWEASSEVRERMNIIGMVTAYVQIHRIG